MASKIQFLLSNYAQLVIFICSCYGLAACLLRRWNGGENLDKGFFNSLKICVGLGVHILLLQALGIFGLLTKPYLSTLLSIGLIGFALDIFAKKNLNPASLEQDRTKNPTFAQHWFFPALLCLIAIELVTRPLHPPTAWDEVMYHLPHAREWAAAGKLTVNEWLRYPLFPYNFNLLYAEALIFENDVFPHMIHAFSGTLVAFALYRLARNYFDSTVASTAVTLFLILALGQFNTAYIDLGLTLFIFFGFSCVYFWYETKRKSWIYLAMFLLGMAAGIKHQALIFTPFLALVVLIRERKPMHLTALLGVFLLPCIFWYLRSYFVAGDPVNPLGARLFGYWGWNAKDMELQLADIKRVADWPNWCVWPALGVLFLRNKFTYFPLRASLLLATYTFFAWLLTSHYSRYLLPVAPLLALLTAIVLRTLYLKLFKRSDATESPRREKKISLVSNGVASVCLAALAIALVPSFSRHWNEIQVTQDERAAYLRTRISSFEIAEFLQRHPEYRLVQLGLESDMYYLPPNTIGDVFGPGRYAGFLGISPAELKERIRNFGANALLLSKAEDFQKIKNSTGFSNHFILKMNTSGAELYELTQSK